MSVGYCRATDQHLCLRHNRSRIDGTVWLRLFRTHVKLGAPRGFLCAHCAKLDGMTLPPVPTTRPRYGWKALANVGDDVSFDCDLCARDFDIKTVKVTTSAV